MRFHAGLFQHCLSACFALCLPWITTELQAAQPPRFNYQAKLTDSGGTPLAGTQTLHLSLWHGGSAETANSGTQVYGETAAVTADNGLVNHTVGTGTSTFGGALNSTIFATNSAVYLQVAVGSTSNVVLPRTRLESVPFAIQAAASNSAFNGIPSGFAILGTSPTAPAGFTATGQTIAPSWQPKAAIPTARYTFGLAAASGKIYVVGGQDATDTLEKNEEYDPALNRWLNRAPLTPGRAYLTCDTVNGVVHACGGITTASTSAVTSNDAYNPLTNTWSIRQPLLAPRAAHSSVVVDNKLYLLGGVPDQTISSIYATVDMYNPDTNSWTPRAPMTVPRYYGAAANVDGNIHLLGGFTSVNSITDSHEVYDPVLNTWTTRASLPKPHAVSSAVGYNGKLYVIGGFYNNTALSDTWIYDPATNEWSLGVSMSTGRAQFGAVLLNGLIYAVSGTSVGGVDIESTEALAPDMFYIFRKN